MYQTPVRSTTATTGKTVLAIVAILSLLLSLFAITRPVLAEHGGAHLQDSQQGTPFDDPGQNEKCPSGDLTRIEPGETLWHFVLTSPQSDEGTITVTFERANGTQFTVTQDDDDSNASVLHFYVVTESGLTLVDAETDVAGGNLVLSHICNEAAPPSVDVEKTGPPLSKATDGALYTVTVENTGGTILYIESIVDSLQGDLTDAANVDTSDCGASLAIGAMCTITYTYVVQADDPDPLGNTVTVDADTMSDFTGTEVTDTDSFSVELFQPDISVTKDGSATEAMVGDDITYTVTISNDSSSDSPDLMFDAINDTLQGDLTDAANVDTSDCSASLAAGDSCTITYTRTVLDTDADPLVNTVTVESHPDGFPNDIDDEASFTVDILQKGSITVTKEVGCEECETRTIGYYFNTADQHKQETNDLFTALGGIEADGILFMDVDRVQQYRADDQNGTSDGQVGLSATGQLTLQYLAAVLNVARNGEDCDLANRVYNNADSPLDGMTVQEILDEAVKAFDGDDTNDTYAIEDIKSALDDINNSSHEDENPLSCEGSESGTVDGVTFDLYLEADYPESAPIDSQTTANGGVALFENLELDMTYVLVESAFPEGMTCTIVDVMGDGFEWTLNEDGSVTIELTADHADISITVVNDCEEGQEEDKFGEIEIRKSAEDDPSAEFGFSASWDADGFTLMDGGAEFSGDLPAGEQFTVTEELTEEQIAAGWSLADIDCGDADVTVDGNSVMITVVADSLITCTFTNALAEEGEGILEIEKFFCPADEDGTQFVVSDPAPLENLRTQGVDEDPEGCTTGDATFTIENNDTHATMEVSTGDDGLIEVDLEPGSYTITETSTDEDPAPSATFTVEDGAITAVIVINNVGEDEEEGQIKIIKLFCDGDEDSVTFTIEGGEQLPPSLENCELGDAAFKLNDGDTFTIGDDGILFANVEVGTYTLSEVLPNQATSPAFEVELGEITTVIVVNTEGEQGGEEEMVEVSIMKHLCTDVATVDEFEAVEAAAAEENPDNAFAPLVATVLACPTIILTGDVPSEGAISGGEVDFDFSVIDEDGNQMLSDDTTFMQAKLCETDVNLDADGDGEITDDVCLDISHYTFEVVDGLLVITETDAPDGHHLGTIRFTPGSDDADTLVGSIATVEATGVITIDTTKDGDDAVMIHAYNFANEGTQGGNPPPGGGEGTAGGNPLPNTSMDLGSTGTVPAAILALLMLSGLGAAAYAVKAEARRRR